MTSKMPANEWVSARNALRIMTSNSEDPNATMGMFAAYLRLGELKAQAREIWESKEPTIAKAWKIRSGSHSGYVDIPTKYWRSHIAWADDVQNWRWPGSSFHVTLALEPAKRRMMRGVRFNKADLAKLQPDYFGEGRSGRRGPKADLSRRDVVWLELITMALMGELTDPVKAAFDNKGDLSKLLEERLNVEGKAKRSGKNIISGIASQTFDRVEFHKNSI